MTVREAERLDERLSLSTAAAWNLATTTKTAPQMQEITSRWSLKLLPSVQVSGGAYRVNRRLAFTVGDGRITFINAGERVRVIPEELRELPLLRGFDDVPALRSLADRFTQQEFAAGEVIARSGQAADRVILIAHGKVQKLGAGAYGDQTVLGVLADGEFFGDGVLADGQPRPDTSQHGEKEIALAAGHDGEPAQLKLTVHALRERQEHELVNNLDFGLLHNAGLRQRIHTRTGPPTPDDLLSRRRWTRYLLAHPRAIAAFGRECTARGVDPSTVDVDGQQLTGWRDVPMLPRDKIPVTGTGCTSIIAMRTLADDQGVVGLRQTGLPDEYEPGLNVRFMGIDERGIICYLVSTYHSAAVLVPDALGVLDSVEVDR